jgi:hypothetical protein
MLIVVLAALASQLAATYIARLATSTRYDAAMARQVAKRYADYEMKAFIDGELERAKDLVKTRRVMTFGRRV